MQYDAATPEEYIEILQEDWRKDKILELRIIIKNIWPALEEGIDYKMLCFSYGEKKVFHLNAQAAYVSLYVGNIDKVENARSLLKEFNLGKGCIRIKKSINLSNSKLEVFITEVMNIWQAGDEISC